MKKKALLVWGGWDGHEPEKTTAIFNQELKAADYETEVSDTLDAFLDVDRLKTFDLVVPNWTMGQLTGDQENALVQAIESGVGLGGFHGGMGDAFRSNTNYQFMVGGQFVAHPDNHKDYTVKIVNHIDSITAHLKDFAVHSEQYYMHVDPLNEVLAITEFQSESAPWINGVHMPVVWKRRHGLGKVFYCSLGHNAAVFEIPEAKELTRRGLLWATR